MNKSLSTIKKFQFFDLEKLEPDGNKQQQSVSYNLSNMNTVQLRVYNKLYYVSGQLKGDPKKNLNRFRLVKLHPCGKIIDEYIPFSDSIIDFDIKDLDGKTYLIALGTDLRNPSDEFGAKVEMKQSNQISRESSSIKVNTTENSVPSIKIFDFSKFVEKTNCELNNWQGITSDEDEIKNRLNILEAALSPLVIIYLMRKNNNENEFFTGNALTSTDKDFLPIKDIYNFSVSPRINDIAFSLGNDILYEIKVDDNLNLISTKERKYNLIKSMDGKPVTNIKHIILANNLYLYFTTTDSTYYKNCQESQVYLVGDQNIHSGAEETNFDVSSNNKILLSTTGSYYLEEYDYFGEDSKYMKIRSKVFEKPTKFIQIFKGYHVFVLYEENMCTLCVYDPNNNIFILYNNGLNNILSVISDNNKLYFFCTYII